MTPSLYLRHVRREMRGGAGRLVFFAGCLGIGVAAVVAIAGLSASFKSGFRDKAKELLGADLVARAYEPLPDELDTALSEIPGAEWMVTREQPQVVQAGSDSDLRSLLAELMVVGPGYPYYGDLELQPKALLTDLLRDNAVVVAPEVLSRMNLNIGDTIRVGDAQFHVAGVANYEPDRITGFMYIGPRVYLSPEAFARSGLQDVGTRIRYKAMVKLPDMPPDEIQSLKETLETTLESAPYVRFETYTEGRPSLQRGLDRLERFLGLIALLSLLLGGVGVAQAVRAWIAGRMDSIAVFKCIGMRPREVFALHVFQALLLGLGGSAVGALLGIAVMALIPIVFAAYLPAHILSPWQPAAVIRGLALGVAVTMVFSLPPLIGVLQVPPVLVFRRNAEPLPKARWVSAATALLIVAGIGVMTTLQARSLLLGAVFMGGVLATGLVLALGAWIVVKLTTRIPRERLHQVWLRYGLAALARPGANALPSIVALGMGLLVIFCATVVQLHLNRQLAGTIPKNAPSAVMINVRPNQIDGLNALLRDRGATDIVAMPLVVSRVAALNGVSVDDIAENAGGGSHRQRRLRSEQWMTYVPDLPAANSIVKGQWWHDPDVPELSLEKHWAERLHLDVGSHVTFAFPGREVEFVVSNLREIEWEELGINFDIIAEPGYLDNVPQLRIATLRLPPGAASDAQNRVVAAYPNVTFVPVGDVLERIAAQLNRISWGVRFLGLFIVAAAIAVLAGAVGIESSRRGAEVALLKTVGMTRREVAGVFAAEYALMGLVAGIIGITGGGVVAWLMIDRAFEFEFHWPWALFAAALLTGMALTVLAGIAASANALRRRPIEVLRHAE